MAEPLAFTEIERIAAAQAYIDALVSHDASAHIDETFVIPVEDGKIHHIKAIVRPFLTTS